jgi:hypothetical protein
MSSTILIGRALRILRMLAAGVLLAAFFLPLARCEGVRSQGTGVASPPSEELMVPAHLVDMEEPATLLVAVAFGWPLLLLALYAALPTARRFEFIEPLPIALTFWYQWQITVEWGEVLWAGYTALAATALYGIAALLHAPAAWRAWRARR